MLHDIVLVVRDLVKHHLISDCVIVLVIEREGGREGGREGVWLFAVVIGHTNLISLLNFVH